MLLARDPVRGPSPKTRTPATRVGMLLVGAVLVAAAGLMLVQLLLALAFETSVPLAARSANLAVFGLPAALVLVAGAMLVRAAAGLAPQISVRPVTTPGRWAAGLVGGTVAALITFFLLTTTGQITGAETFLGDVLPAIVLLAAWASASLGSVAGVVAMGWHGERSMTVLAAVGIGLFVSLFGLGELLFPH